MAIFYFYPGIPLGNVQIHGYCSGTVKIGSSMRILAGSGLIITGAFNANTVNQKSHSGVNFCSTA